MPVLRDATYATLGARASLCTCRGTSSHFEVAYDGVARLARPHMRTCICLFSKRRACAVSAFFTFGRLGPHTRLCARKGPFPRSFSALPIFFIFLKITSHAPLCCSCCMRLPLSAKQRCNRAATVPSDAAACVCLCHPHLELQLQRSGQLQVHRSASVSCSCIALPLSAAPCIRATYTLSHPTHSLLAPSIHSALVLCLSVNTAYQSYMYISIYILIYIYIYI